MEVDRHAAEVDLAAGVEFENALAADQAQVLPDLDEVALADAVGLGRAHQQHVVELHRTQAVVADGDGLVHADALDPVVAHRVGFIHLDDDVLVALGVDVQLLGALLVLHADFVEVGRRAALAGAALDAALGSVGGQVVGHGLFGVVDAAGDDRLVGVAFEEADDDLLADARNLDMAPVLAGPGLRDANPAGAVFVGLVVTIPVEVHLDPAILVGPDLLAGGADHHGGLRPLHHGLGRAAQRAKGLLGVGAGELALELATAATAALQGFLRDVIARAHHQVFTVLVGAAEAGKAEQVARGDAAHAAADFDALVQALQGLDTVARVLLAIAALHVGTGIVV